MELHWQALHMGFAINITRHFKKELVLETQSKILQNRLVAFYLCSGVHCLTVLEDGHTHQEFLSSFTLYLPILILQSTP